MTTSSRKFGKQTRMQLLCGRIHDLAQKLGPDAKLPKLTELRDSLGASIATIDLALSELEAQNVIYRKHGVGIYVSSRLNQRSVALICESSFFRGAGHSPFWDMLVEKARERAADGNETFGLHFASFEDARTVALHGGIRSDIEAGRLSGVLGVGLLEVTADWLTEIEIPFVAFAGPSRWMVGLDRVETVRLGVKALAQQGCRHLEYWKPVTPFRPVVSSGDDVSSGGDADIFRSVLRKYGLAFEPTGIRDNVHLLQGGAPNTQTHQEQGYHTACEVFSRPRTQWPDGLVISDDMMTHGALVALQKLGVRVGCDVKIATSANCGSEVLLGREDELTLIESDPSEVIDAMFTTLEALMDGKEVPQDVTLIKPQIRS